MKTPSNSLAVIATSQKPPLRKAELLKAAALALRSKQLGAAQKARLERDSIIADRNKLVIATARKTLRKAQPEVEPPYRTGEPYRVRFTVTVPAEVGRLFEERARVISIPHVEDFKELLTKLYAASGPGDRAEAMVKDPALAEQLVKAGEALLNRTAAPAITA